MSSAKTRRRCSVGLSVLAALIPSWGLAATPAGPPARKIVLIAGALDSGHPKGTHEYEKSAELLQRCLDTSTNLNRIRTEVHFHGWPQNPATLDDADTIVVIGNGSDRKEQDHPLMVGDRLAVIDQQMKRGCGLVLIHWTTFAPKVRAGEKYLDWIGGFFDYESGRDHPQHWLSRIQHFTSTPRPATADHPVCRGLHPFEVREEFYYRIRFREEDPRLKPILVTRAPGEAQDQVVAWAVQRKDGGRGFGFTGGHYYENWRLEDFRKLILNAIVWTARVEVPPGGVASTLPAEWSASR